MDVVPAAQNPALAVPPLAGPAPRSVFVAAALGWLFPGLGQLYVGRPGKALTMLLAIGGLFYAGLALTGFTCVNPNAYKLEFAAHAFLGGPTAATYYLTQDMQLTELMPWFEVGRLYAAVAGLLNIVAVCDAMGEVLDHNKVSRAREALRREWFARQQREFDERAAAIRAQLDAQIPQTDAEEPLLADPQPAHDDGPFDSALDDPAPDDSEAEPPAPDDPWRPSS